MIDNKIAKQNSINNFLNNYFNLFVVLFTSFLLLMSYFLILKPKVDATTMAISDNISQQQRIYQAEQSKLLSLKSTIDSYKKIDPIDSARVNSILPDDYDKERLFGELEEIIIKNGFEPTSITINKEGEESKTPSAGSGSNVALPKVSDKIGVINVSLSIGSIDYANLKNFLGVLENNLRIFDITNVSMGANSYLANDYLLLQKMKKQESKIIYFFVLLIIVIGIAAFIFRAQLANNFLKYDSNVMPAPVAAGKDELTLDLLRNDKIKALKSNFSVFNYEDFNKTQEILAAEFRDNASSLEQIVTNEDGSQTIVKPVFFRVDVGNNNPFVMASETKKE